MNKINFLQTSEQIAAPNVYTSCGEEDLFMVDIHMQQGEKGKGSNRYVD